MSLASGSSLGPYRIGARLGAGGMGEVYRVRDPRLDRSVAIKTLPAEFSSDDRWRARFHRKARTIAGLSHPHICALHVQPFPATGVRWQVSDAGGHQPQWRRDGRELYYVALDKKLIAVEIKASGSQFAWGPRAR
jgi:hypothetical protein